jgi:hypothetical protein
VCGSDAAHYSTFGDDTTCFGANDVTNLEVMFVGLGHQATSDFYQRCSDYDNDGTFRANDLTNMKRYAAGILGLASHWLSGAATPQQRARSLQSSVADIAMEPHIGATGATFLKVTVTAPGNAAFTTLRLPIKTDGVIDASQTVPDFYAVTQGTGTFKDDPAGWQDYSVKLNPAPAGYTGFILGIMSGTGNPSPSSFYILFSSPPTYVDTTSLDPIELADANTPSGVMATPQQVTSSLAPSSAPSPSPSPPGAGGGEGERLLSIIEFTVPTDFVLNEATLSQLRSAMEGVLGVSLASFRASMTSTTLRMEVDASRSDLEAQRIAIENAVSSVAGGTAEIISITEARTPADAGMDVGTLVGIGVGGAAGGIALLAVGYTGLRTLTAKGKHPTTVKGLPTRLRV